MQAARISNKVQVSGIVWHEYQVTSDISGIRGLPVPIHQSCIRGAYHKVHSLQFTFYSIIVRQGDAVSGGLTEPGPDCSVKEPFLFR